MPAWTIHLLEASLGYHKKVRNAFFADSISSVPKSELKKLKDEVKKEVACENPAVNKCEAYKKAMKTGDLRHMMKVILFLIVVGLASARPSSEATRGLSPDPDILTRSLNKTLTKEEFAALVSNITSVFGSGNSAIIPKEFQDFALSITVDDYEAVKYALETINKDGGVFKLLPKMEKKFPDIHKRFMAAYNHFSKRWDALSQRVKREMGQVIYLYYRMEEENFTESYQNAILYVQWSSGLGFHFANNEVDALFPGITSIVLHDGLKDVGKYELEKISDDTNELLACDDPDVHNCRAYEQALETGDFQDLQRPMIGPSLLLGLLEDVKKETRQKATTDRLSSWLAKVSSLSSFAYSPAFISSAMVASVQSIGALSVFVLLFFSTLGNASLCTRKWAPDDSCYDITSITSREAFSAYGIFSRGTFQVCNDCKQK
uniref:Uncharacterized protein n=1 Tax=Steinernema glaseri TaxID=37863 RepID=A0A1I7YC06_9BILA